MMPYGDDDDLFHAGIDALEDGYDDALEIVIREIELARRRELNHHRLFWRRILSHG